MYFEGMIVTIYSMIIVDSKWLATHLDDPNLVIIDSRENMSLFQ